MKRRGNTEVPEPAANTSPARAFLRERDGYLRELKPLRSAGPLTHFTRTDLTATLLHSCALLFVVRRKCEHSSSIGFYQTDYSMHTSTPALCRLVFKLLTSL